MHAQRVPYAKALETVRRARPWVRPNAGFEKALLDYARRLGV